VLRKQEKKVLIRVLNM